ncbi:Polyketide cyclase / dehydrase and lipid transport [Nocardia otitidiscaviarum]|uniref:Polyketide cyclase / dehydrase and lipid transport n=1 Tax=Nocardia otitidiscaviarum TaxID=1823 RepID=A0A378YAG0_9NOCA|nr:SRPBCC family protein [Nocardia otitidiscaviarum]SUA73530.1 Polyketide cyclase / dehydrase and lipid transport [Nocardia otitidiscaviarum]
MRGVEVERTIPAPITDVFDWLTDVTNFQRVPWIRRVTLVRPGDTNGNGVGAVRLIVTPLMRLTEEIVEYTPPTRVRYRVLSSVPRLRTQDGKLELSEHAEGTLVNWYSTFEVDNRCPKLSTCAYLPLVRGGFHLVLRTATKELRGE